MFFLQAVHTPLQTPKSYIYPYRDMVNVARRKFAAMVSTVDEAVRNVTYALRKYGYYRNSVIIYSTDNGAQPFTGGSNWPLRGRKVETINLSYFKFFKMSIKVVLAPALMIFGLPSFVDEVVFIFKEAHVDCFCQIRRS